MARRCSAETSQARPIYSFAASAGGLPAEVLAQAREELVNWRGSGLSPLALPFTSDEFRRLWRQAREDLRALLDIPPHYRILFMPGGASAQFALVPLNLLGAAPLAGYVETGYWSAKSLREARRHGAMQVVASSAASGFDRVPEGPWTSDPRAAYCHFTSNETAHGLQCQAPPETGAVPLVADMTSDFLSRHIDVGRFGLIYASAQKNLGPAGLTIVIVREDLLGRAHPATPTVFNYQAQARADSLLQTPATYAAYLTALVLRWLRRVGGVAAMARRGQERSALLYRVIDTSDGYYRCAVRPAHRSRMNVCFTLADAALTPLFVAEATRHGLLYLQGHPEVGGLRASLYNAMPMQGAAALADFMRRFAQEHPAHV